MALIITGMKRQVHEQEDNESVCSNIEENVKLEEDFFSDWFVVFFIIMLKKLLQFL